MNSRAVLTVTCNPTIDLSSEAEQVAHTSKTRTVGERMDAGGGGINVARVLHRFGVPVNALFLGGGVTGQVLDALLDRAGLAHQMLPISGDTRLGLTVLERSSGHEYRFVPEGPCVEENEWRPLLDAIASSAADWLVLSGSIPRCAPTNLFALLAKKARPEARVLLDSSRAPLCEALSEGSFFMVKPSHSELEALTGETLETHAAIARAAMRLIEVGKTEVAAVTLGRDGAILVTTDGASYLPAVPVQTRSAVGAGDSFLAAMVVGLIENSDLDAAFRLAVAAGAAATLTPGTNLCYPNDVSQLLARTALPEPVRF